MEDEGGVLGNLPRSRPGTRSQKRASGRGTKQAAGKESRPAGARRPTQQAGRGAPIGEALKLAGRVPLIGVRVATGMTRELWRRTPRP
jgi:hypothetical protein